MSKRARLTEPVLFFRLRNLANARATRRSGMACFPSQPDDPDDGSIQRRPGRECDGFPTRTERRSGDLRPVLIRRPGGSRSGYPINSGDLVGAGLGIRSTPATWWEPVWVSDQLRRPGGSRSGYPINSGDLVGAGLGIRSTPGTWWEPVWVSDQPRRPGGSRSGYPINSGDLVGAGLGIRSTWWEPVWVSDQPGGSRSGYLINPGDLVGAGLGI
jgi:hypothetical protein